MRSIVRIALLGVLFLLPRGLANGQEASSVENSSPKSEASAEELRPLCQDADDLFANHFDLYLTALSGTFVLVLPLALPMLGIRPWWVLAHPYHRWFFWSFTGVFIFGIVVYVPALAVAFGWLPSKYALVLFGVDGHYPANCGGTGIATAGFLWGKIDAGRELSILSIPKMALSWAVMSIGSAAIYWVVFLSWRRFRPLQPAR